MDPLNQQLFKFNSTQALEVLLEAGADVDTRDEHGDTPLHASYLYSPQSVELLLLYGADVRAINDDQDTPLHTLAKAINLNCLSQGVIDKFILLVKYGADIQQPNLKGYTPWEYLDAEAREKLISVETLYNKLKLNATIPQVERGKVSSNKYKTPKI